MFPFRTSSIFRNRWIALLWAAGICWTAIDLAGSADSGDANNQSAAAHDNGTELANGGADIAAMQSKLRNW